MPRASVQVSRGPLLLIGMLLQIILLLNTLVFASGNSESIRLIGGPHYGRLEVYNDGEWGTVCDDGWDASNAHVACRQLGYKSALAFYGSAHYGQGTGSIWLDAVDCVGSEPSLDQCSHGEYGTHDCNHSEDVGVLCNNYTDTIRLMDGSDNHGRVEVYYNGEWGTICDDAWDINDGHVACRQLGFPSALAVYGGGQYPQGSGTIWMDDVRCGGSEYSLSQCGHNGYGTHDCSHSEDASVLCESLQSDNIRLVGGASSYGRVEVYYSGEWGTVCDDGWDITDAAVVCHQLGFSSALESYGSAYYGEGSGTIWMDNVACLGSETSLDQCNHNGYGTHNCGHQEDASVSCNVDRPHSNIRLVGGLNYGRVEVYYSGAWGTVCDDSWDMNDATVVCRQLGYSSASESYGSAHYGQGSGNIWMDGVTCSGSETSLDQCNHNGYGTHDCSHGEDAGVACGERPDIQDIRLSASYYGRVEVMYNDQWGTICDDFWDLNNAHVVCRQLGFPSATVVEYHGRAHYGEGSGPIWMDDVTCSGAESSIGDCTHLPFGRHNCMHSEDVGVRCGGVADVILRCGPTSFQVDIPRHQVFYEEATNLYFDGAGDDSSCRGFDNDLYISLNSSLTGCGTRYTANHNFTMYHNTVADTPEGSAVVEYYPIEIPLTCTYDKSTILETNFQVISDSLTDTLSESGAFDYDLAVYSTIDYDERITSYPITASLRTKLYFRAEHLRAPGNLEIHLRRCRATPTADYDDDIVYEIIEDGCGVSNVPVRVLTPEEPSQADFELLVFRFREDLVNASQVWVQCEVLSCDVDDEDSECNQGCEVQRSRRRRSADHPPSGAKRIHAGPIILVDDFPATEGVPVAERGDPFVNNIILPTAGVILIIVLVIGALQLLVLRRRNHRDRTEPVELELIAHSKCVPNC